MTAEGEGDKARQPHPIALIVAGPTCSGKSALALHIAERAGGTVINADSMQIYAELRVVTARPSPEEEARAPHALYGVRPAGQAGTAAWWRTEALAAMQTAKETGRVPILCGGTGLYFEALRHGLAKMPVVPEAARAEARALLAQDGPAVLHGKLGVVDPAAAARLLPQDSQRLARAWEVWLGTGRSLSSWQAEPRGPAAPWRFRAVLLDPPRPDLRRAAALRFDAMLTAGVLEEMRALLALHLDPALPAMRALGVPELTAAVGGELAIEEAVRRAVVATGQYTKRQATWFRHHDLADPCDTHMIHARYTDQTQLSEMWDRVFCTF